jgi:hypothetical protein
MTFLISLNPQPDAKEDYVDVIKEQSNSCPLHVVAKRKTIYFTLVGSKNCSYNLQIKSLQI